MSPEKEVKETCDPEAEREERKEGEIGGRCAWIGK
jgi:hypothetical protein